VCTIRQGLRLSLSHSLFLSLFLSLSPSGPSISVGSRPVSGCEQHVFVHTDGKVIFSFALCRGEARKRDNSAWFVTAFSAPRVRPHLPCKEHAADTILGSRIESMLCSSHPLTHAPQHPRPLTLMSRGRSREGHRREVATHERGAQPAGGEVCPRR
jgi:hypothetical protein